MLDNTPNQSSKFRTKNGVEINDGSRGTYKANSQMKLKAVMLKSSLCNYSDAYIFISWTKTTRTKKFLFAKTCVKYCSHFQAY